MEICFNIGGLTHCYLIPVVEVPVHLPHPGPGPINYPQLFQDAMLVTSLRALASRVSDTGVRDALEGGISAATQALQERGGKHVSIRHADYIPTYDPGAPGGNAGTPGGVAGGYSPGRDFNLAAYIPTKDPGTRGGVAGGNTPGRDFE